MIKFSFKANPTLLHKYDMAMRVYCVVGYFEIAKYSNLLPTVINLVLLFSSNLSFTESDTSSDDDSRPSREVYEQVKESTAALDQQT